MYISPLALRMLEIHAKQQNKDLEVNLKEFHRILDTLIYLHETIAELKIKMPEWKTYSDTLMTKFYFHSTTFYNILSGTEIKSNYLEFGRDGKKIIDTPSAKIIFRAQFETFLMFHHIYVNPSSDEDKELRFNAWMYSSLLERQSFPSDTDYAVKMQKLDKIEIEKIKKQMMESLSFKKLSLKQQKGLIEKGSDKLFKTWDSIMKETGFSENHSFYTYYSILSSYAHSEGLSILQIKQSNFGYNKFNEQANINVLMSIQLICLMIFSVKKMYKIVEIKFNGLPQEIQDTIAIYAEMARLPMHNTRKK